MDFTMFIADDPKHMCWCTRCYRHAMKFSDGPICPVCDAPEEDDDS